MAARTLLLAIQMQTAQAVREMETMRKQMERMTKHTGNMGKSMFNAQVAFAAFQRVMRGVTQFLSGSITKFIEQERVEAQLNQTLKSTAYAAGMTAEELKNMAKGLQSMTAYGDEAVIGAENLLLTFTNIGKDIFPQALETVLDMSTALGQDLKSSSVQLGKALQDPILGVTALRRVGVNFNEAQTEVIKNLVNTGHAAEAQKLILKELQTEFGGSARAARDTLGGSLAALKNQFGDLQETMGAKFAPVIRDMADKLIPRLEGPFNQLGDALTSILDVFIEILPTILDLAAAFTPIIDTILNLAVTLFEALKPAFEQIVRIIGIVAPILDKLFKAVAPLVEIFGDVFATALEVVADLLETIAPILNLILDILKPIFEALKPIVHILGEVLKPILELIFLPLKLLMDTIKQIGAAIDDSLHHWANLAKANAEAIDGLTKTREEYQKMEEAIKSGSAKQSELLKTQNELIEKYPELSGAIDLVNGSYDSNVNAINTAIKARKEEQIYLLEQTREEVRANLRRMDSWRILRKIQGVFNPVQAAMWDNALKEQTNKMISLGGEIKVAKQELVEFQKALDNPPKPPKKDKPKKDVPALAGTPGEDDKKGIIKDAQEIANALIKVDVGTFEKKKTLLERYTEIEAEQLKKQQDNFKAWADQVASGIGSVFGGFGEALAKGEDAWAAFAKAGIEALAGILDSLAQQLLAQAVATLAQSIWPPNPAGWAAAGALTAAGAGAALAAGLVRGWAGTFAEGGSFLTNGPTMMTVGDNPGGVEQVTVTPVSSKGVNADTMIIQQPVIITIDGNPIYRGLLRASKSGIALISARAVVK